MEPTVFVVDDDKVILNIIAQLFESVDLNVKTFTSAQDFLNSYSSSCSGCLVLDVRMPGMGGLKLQSKLANEKIPPQIIFITGHGDIPMASEAFRAGAVDFIEKPFRNQVLIDRTQEALVKDAAVREKQAQREAIARKLTLLTPREQQVLELVRSGKLNKVIANELNIRAI